MSGFYIRLIPIDYNVVFPYFADFTLLEVVIMDTKSFNEYSLLIADDDDVYREHLYKILGRHFGTVLEARDGEDALTLYQNEQPDMIITDISMPSLDGISLIKKIRANDLKTKIIVTSGHTERHFLLDAIPLQISRYIVKPFEFEELLQTIIESFQKKNETENVLLFRHRCDGEGEMCLCRLDRQNHTITCDDNTEELSVKEYRLLEALIKNGNRVLSYETIEDLVWEGEYMSSNALRTLIKKVRQKTCRDLIKNVASYGYRIDLHPV